GEKINIFDLAKKLQVSRTPVKEAFNRLRDEGLLMIEPQNGTYVTELAPPRIRELFEVRLMMELWAARKIIQARDTGVPARMKATLVRCEKVLSSRQWDLGEFLQCDREFHLFLVESARNDQLNRFYEPISLHMKFLRIYAGRGKERARLSHQQHVEIVKALES